MKAEERLRYYASIFPIVEADAPYYYPPTEEMAGMWVNRTPERFTMNIKAYSLFTNHPTRPDSLWPEVAEDVPLEHRDKRSVYLSHLPEPAATSRQTHALMNNCYRAYAVNSGRQLAALLDEGLQPEAMEEL